MIEEVREKLADLIAVCRANGVRRAWLYGSATGNGRRAFDPKTSDVDLLVEFDPKADVSRGWNHPLFRLPERLEVVLGGPVHVTENKAFENPYFREEVANARNAL